MNIRINSAKKSIILLDVGAIMWDNNYLIINTKDLQISIDDPNKSLFDALLLKCQDLTIIDTVAKGVKTIIRASGTYIEDVLSGTSLYP